MIMDRWCEGTCWLITRSSTGKNRWRYIQTQPGGLDPHLHMRRGLVGRSVGWGGCAGQQMHSRIPVTTARADGLCLWGGPTGVSMATGGVDGVPIVLIAARPRSETSAAIFQLPNTNTLTPTTKDTRPRIIIFFSFVQLFTHFSFSSLFVVFFPEISPRSFLFFFLCGSGFFFCLRLSCRRGPTGATGRWWHNQPRPEDNARSRGTRPAACGHFIVALLLTTCQSSALTTHVIRLFDKAVFNFYIFFSSAQNFFFWQLASYFNVT